MSFLGKIFGNPPPNPEKALAEPARQGIRFGEKATIVDDIYQAWRMLEYNPDDLASIKGGLRIYKKMGKDEQIKACLALKKAAIIGRGWEIKGENKEHVAFVTHVFENMSGTVERTIAAILSAFQYGYSVHEKVFEIIREGSFKGKVGYKALKQKSPTSFRFRLDKFGNLEPNGLIQMQEYGKEVRLPIEKFLIFSYQKEFSNYYGESDLYAAHRSWFIKDKVVKYWAIYLERGAIPVPYAQAMEGRTLDPGQITALSNVLRRLTAGTSMVLPDGVEVGLLGGDKNRPISYEKAIQTFDLRIARSILIPTMIGYTDMEQGGAYSQSQTNFDAFEFILAMTTADLEEDAFMEQIIKEIVSVNYGIQDKYPRFKFKPMSEEKKRELLALWSNAVVRGAVTPTEKDELYLRGIMGMPEMTEEEIGKEKDKIAERGVPPQGSVPPPNPKEGQQYSDLFDETILKRKIDYRKYMESLDGIEEEAKRELSEAFDESITLLIEDIKKKQTPLTR